MSSRLPFGNNTLVIPFTFVRPQPRPRGGGGMSRMEDQRALFRHGVAPPTFSIRGERSYAPVPPQAPSGPGPQPSARLASAAGGQDPSVKEMPERETGPASGTADRSQAAVPSTGTQTPAPAVEPEHDRLWWWLYNHGLTETRHERAVGLRRAYGSQSAEVWFLNGAPVDIDGMSDDEVLEFVRQLSMLAAFGAGPGRQPPPPPWGWRGSPSYNEAKRQLRKPGTHTTVNGHVPTREEAVQLIEDGGGIIHRIEEGHPPPSRSTHREHHINYRVPVKDGYERATVIVKPWE